MEELKSELSGKLFPADDCINTKTIQNSVFKLIKKDYPALTKNMIIAKSELAKYKEMYFTHVLQKQFDQLSDLDKTVLDSLTNNDVLSSRLDDEKVPTSLGSRVADRVAEFGGSWTFICICVLVLIFWISVNVYWFQNKGFDPYPFILLNLILSCVAALQAPIIMMSQNRQEEKDRDRAKNDYMVNLKAEIEIRALHEKIDLLILQKEDRLLSIEKEQFELLQQLLIRIDSLEKQLKS